MAETKCESEFEPSNVGNSARCWQIDNDRLPPPLDSGEWESLFAEALVDLAEAHETSTLTCFTSSGGSVDFGRPGFSVWIALSGSGPVVKAAGDILRELITADFIRACSVSDDATWNRRIRIADGKVWRPLDAVNWIAISATEDTGAEEEEEWDEPKIAHSAGESGRSTSAAGTPPKRKKPLNAARNDVRVGYYQRKIERLLSLPEGSVKLVNPDRSISHPAQLIGSLRERWDD